MNRTTEQNACIDYADKLADTIKVSGKYTPSVEVDEDKITIGFPDLGYESEKACNEIRDLLESDYPDVVTEWIIEEPMDRDGFRAFSIEGWWK